VKEEIEAMNESIINSTQQMTNTFVTGLMEGQNALEGFKNFTKSLVSQIISTFLNLLVVNNILNAIFGRFGMAPLPAINNLGSLLGGGGGSVGGGATVTPQPSAAIGIMRSPIPPRMTGGSVTSGRPYLVGERGPELFTPHTAGTVSNSTGSEGSPIVVNQTINLSAGVVGTVRTEVQRMLPEIANVTKLGVLEATRRGGAYRKGLLGT